MSVTHPAWKKWLCPACFALIAPLTLSACHRDTPPSLDQVREAMENNASDFIHQAYQEALEAHDMESINSISHTNYMIEISDLSACVSNNTEEDTDAHWECHVQGDITLNGSHHPLDHDIDFYYNRENQAWQMQR